MATINEVGNIVARCPTCKGALASFQWLRDPHQEHGSITLGDDKLSVQYRLFKCGGCGRGALGLVEVRGRYPGYHRTLQRFAWETKEQLELPAATPPGIAAEFREGEQCLGAGCYRAAAGMFRSVLDKTLRANGYKVKRGTPLEQQIDMAANDGVITAARRKRAHEEIRVLGNDVLHEAWREVPEAEVETSRRYAQLLLHDFYDDRDTVLAILREKGRVPEEDVPPEEGEPET